MEAYFFNLKFWNFIISLFYSTGIFVVVMQGRPMFVGMILSYRLFTLLMMWCVLVTSRFDYCCEKTKGYRFFSTNHGVL